MSESLQMLLVFYGAFTVPALIACGIAFYLYRKYGRRREHYRVAKHVDNGALRA
jgi:energy-converting hydrogenase Eha subunit G